jgi:hypothetical protein
MPLAVGPVRLARVTASRFAAPDRRPVLMRHPVPIRRVFIEEAPFVQQVKNSRVDIGVKLASEVLMLRAQHVPVVHRQRRRIGGQRPSPNHDSEVIPGDPLGEM